MGSRLLEVIGLKKYFRLGGGFMSAVSGYVRAVDGVDLEIRRGETLGLVGESGCGKTTLGYCVIGLEKSTEGEILYYPLGSKDDPLHVNRLKGSRLRWLRKKMQIVFQDPAASLDPKMLVRDSILEPLRIHNIVKGREANGSVAGLLADVGLTADHLYRYPHELSGGEKQRVCIGRAIALNPAFVVLDEPTSALDVSIQAKILNLLKHLQEKYDLTYLFISHDLCLMRHIADRVAVMYIGKIVEIGRKNDVFKQPLHPYTEALISSTPEPDPDFMSKVIPLRGEVPSSEKPPAGCRFHPRCPKALDGCGKLGREPCLERARPEHLVACYLYN